MDPIAEGRSRSKQSGSIGGRKADRLPRELAGVCHDVRRIIPEGTVRSNDDCSGRCGRYSSCRPLKPPDVNGAIAGGKSGPARQHPQFSRISFSLDARLTRSSIAKRGYESPGFRDGSRNSFGVAWKSLRSERSETVRTDPNKYTADGGSRITTGYSGIHAAAMAGEKGDLQQRQLARGGYDPCGSIAKDILCR